MYVTHRFELEVSNDKVSLKDTGFDGYNDVVVLLDTTVGPVLCALHLRGMM